MFWVKDREISDTTESYLAEESRASVKHPRAAPRESQSTRWVLPSMVVWSNGAANEKIRSTAVPPH